MSEQLTAQIQCASPRASKRWKRLQRLEVFGERSGEALFTKRASPATLLKTPSFETAPTALSQGGRG